MKFLFFTLVLFLAAAEVSSQYYLELKRRTKVIQRYQAGDEIQFKLKGEKYFNKGRIIGFSDQKIKLRFSEIAISEIQTIRVAENSRYGVELLSNAAITAGVFFILIDQGNQLLVQDEGLGPSSQTLLISGSLVGGGLLLKLLQKKKFSLKNTRYRLVTTDFNASDN